MGEWKTGKSSDILKTTLGSCVGILLYSVKHKTGGICHVLLGEPPSGKIIHKGKYARTAISVLYSDLVNSGTSANSLKACLFGGSTMFYSKTNSNLQNIGDENVRISKEVLNSLKIPLFFEDTGGNKGRTVILYLNEGRVLYSTDGKDTSIYLS